MSQQIKAKFVCNSVTDNGYSKTVNLSAIYGKEGENAGFAKATPSGSFQMNVDKDTLAYDLIKPRDEFYIYLEKIEKPESE